jgi:membrane carboxypeptidase/penicillin-binding protein
MKRWLLRGLLAFVVLTAIGMAAVIAVVYRYSGDLPDNRALEEYVPAMVR